MKEGTAPTIAGGNENFVTTNDGSGGIGTVTGFPFFKGKRLTISGVQDDEAVRFKDCDVGVFSAFKGDRGSIGGAIILAFPDDFARIFIEGIGRPGLDE